EARGLGGPMVLRLRIVAIVTRQMSFPNRFFPDTRPRSVLGVQTPQKSPHRWWRSDSGITIRLDGAPHPGGRCVLYASQRRRRAFENPALEVALRAANDLAVPVVTSSRF